MDALRNHVAKLKDWGQLISIFLGGLFWVTVLSAALAGALTLLLPFLPFLPWFISIFAIFLFAFIALLRLD